MVEAAVRTGVSADLYKGPPVGIDLDGLLGDRYRVISRINLRIMSSVILG